MGEYGHQTVMQKPTPENLLNLKETLLLLSVCYFYGLAFALHFEKPTFGLDTPPVFLVMGTIFLTALALEVLLAWWSRLAFILWAFLWLVSYGVIGLYVAPRIFGPEILLYVYAEPVIVIFMGGFAFSFGRLIAEAFLPQRRLSRDQMHKELLSLPGWRSEGSGIVKTYQFKTFPDALNFVNRVARVAESMHHHPDIHTEKMKVHIRLTSHEYGGVAMRDIREAKKIDAVAL